MGCDRQAGADQCSAWTSHLKGLKIGWHTVYFPQNNCMSADYRRVRYGKSKLHFGCIYVCLYINFHYSSGYANNSINYIIFLYAYSYTDLISTYIPIANYISDQTFPCHISFPNQMKPQLLHQSSGWIILFIYQAVYPIWA